MSVQGSLNQVELKTQALDPDPQQQYWLPADPHSLMCMYGHPWALNAQDFVAAPGCDVSTCVGTGEGLSESAGGSGSRGASSANSPSTKEAADRLANGRGLARQASHGGGGGIGSFASLQHEAALWYYNGFMPQQLYAGMWDPNLVFHGTGETYAQMAQGMLDAVADDSAFGFASSRHLKS